MIYATDDGTMYAPFDSVLKQGVCHGHSVGPAMAIRDVRNGNSHGAANASAVEMVRYSQREQVKQLPVRSFNPRKRKLACIAAAIRGGRP